MTLHSIKDLAGHMKGIDIAVLSTAGSSGGVHARPMSNNGDVEYDGTSYYFSDGDTQKVRDIEFDDLVTLSFAGKPGLISQKHFFVIVEGRAQLIRDKQQFAEHWSADLDRWFEKGVDTPGLVMIRVKADQIRYWDGPDIGAFRVSDGGAGRR